VQMPIVMVGGDLRIRRFTPAAEKLLNLIPGDIGRSVTDIRLNLDVPDLEAIVNAVMGQGGAFERAVLDREGRWHSLRVRQYRTGDNRIDGAVILLVDIDSARRTGDALREAEERFARMADTSPVLFWVMGPGGVEFVNRAYEEFFGTDLAKLRAADWTELVHPEDRGIYVAAHREAAVQGKPFTAIARVRRRDGTYRWIKSIGAPRGFGGLVGTSIDVTDLKEAERAKNEFLSVLSHELRNPLAAITSAAALLQAPLRGPQDADKVVGIISRQARNMTRLVDDLLDMSRLSRGKIVLRPEAVDLAAAVRTTVEAERPAFKTARQELTCSIPDEPVWIEADPTRLDQIVGNLLRNACKFTPEGGHIWLELATEPRNWQPGQAGSAVLRVRDNGIGIAREEAPRIFDLFTQGERTAQRAQSGVGIGLTLAKLLVDMHGGTIAAHSAGPWMGSEFVVRLPLRATAPHESAPREAQRIPARRILIVDDNRDVAAALGGWLQGEGHTVHVVHEGGAAVGAAEEFDPDVVLLDIGMPDMDGYESARRLRGDTRLDGVYLVALTGFGRDEDVKRTLESGFDDHITKPAAPSDLQRVLLAASRKERQKGA
jgi:PAS domain S-box-containing protein